MDPRHGPGWLSPVARALSPPLIELHRAQHPCSHDGTLPREEHPPGDHWREGRGPSAEEVHEALPGSSISAPVKGLPVVHGASHFPSTPHSLMPGTWGT